MIELFKNVSDRTKEIAENVWNITMLQSNPIKAADFLNNVTNYYSSILTDEEVEFLQFYFNMKMEMMKE